MKKLSFVFALVGMLTLAGCTGGASSSQGADSATALGEVEPMVIPTTSPAVVGEIEPAPEESEAETVPQEESGPVRLMIETVGEKIASASMLDLGSYSWDMAHVDAMGAVYMSEMGEIKCIIDLDALVKDPKILLPEGARIASARCFADDLNVEAVGYTEEGELLLLNEGYSGDVYSVEVDFGEDRRAEYRFVTTRSVSGSSAPPELRVIAEEVCYRMARLGFSWTRYDGSEATTVVADSLSPWQCYERGLLPKIDMAFLSGREVHIALPEGAQISSVEAYSSADEEPTQLSFSGGDIILPAQPRSKVYHITITFDGGDRCGYAFSV